MKVKKEKNGETKSWINYRHNTDDDWWVGFDIDF